MEKRNDNLEHLKIARDESSSLADFYPKNLNFIFDIDDLLDRAPKSETDNSKEEE